MKCHKERHNIPSRDLGPVSRRSRKVFAPGKPWQSLESYDFRAVLFTYFYYERSFSPYEKFRAYTAGHRLIKSYFGAEISSVFENGRHSVTFAVCLWLSLKWCHHFISVIFPYLVQNCWQPENVLLGNRAWANKWLKLDMIEHWTKILYLWRVENHSSPKKSSCITVSTTS